MAKKAATDTVEDKTDKILVTAHIIRRLLPRSKNIVGLIVAKARQKLFDS
jgi:hypothetical protein